jgi:hypothetical protein
VLDYTVDIVYLHNCPPYYRFHSFGSSLNCLILMQTANTRGRVAVYFVVSNEWAFWTFGSVARWSYQDWPVFIPSLCIDAGSNSRISSKHGWQRILTYQGRGRKWSWATLELYPDVLLEWMWKTTKYLRLAYILAIFMCIFYEVHEHFNFRCTHHFTKHNTSIHNILSTAPQLSIF